MNEDAKIRAKLYGISLELSEATALYNVLSTITAPSYYGNKEPGPTRVASRLREYKKYLEEKYPLLTLIEDEPTK